MSSSKGYTQLSHYQRLYMKELLDQGMAKDRIAERLHVHRSTIFNEVKRGSINGVYDPDYAEERARQKRPQNGRQTLIEKNSELAEYIAWLILKKKLSPQKVAEYFREEDHGFEEYPVSAATIYSAIDRGAIPGVTKENLKETNIITVYSDGIRFPEWIRKETGIQNGEKIKIECRKNGDIVLRRIKQRK